MDALEKHAREAADEGAAAGERQAVGQDEVDHRDQRRDGEARHHRVADILLADHAAVEEAEAGDGHHQDERDRGQHPRRVAGIAGALFQDRGRAARRARRGAAGAAAAGAAGAAGAAAAGAASVAGAAAGALFCAIAAGAARPMNTAVARALERGQLNNRVSFMVQELRIWKGKRRVAPKARPCPSRPCGSSPPS